MFTRLLIRIVSIFLMILLGALARRRGVQTGETISRMSAALTNFFYPALIFSSLVGNFSLATLRSNLLLPAGTVIIVVTGYLLGMLAVRVVPGLSAREKDAFLFQCTMNNYSFLPMPLVFMLRGDAAVALLIFSTIGAEVMVWTLGVLALTGNRVSRSSLRHLANAPMLAVVAALAVVAGRESPAVAGLLAVAPAPAAEAGRALMGALDIFGRATVPLAMFLAGGRMAELKPVHLLNRKQAGVSVMRLLVVPAMSLGLLALLPLEPAARLVLTVVAVMPGAVTSVVLSEVYRADAEFAASSVLVTHIFSLLTIPAWLSLLGIA